MIYDHAEFETEEDAMLWAQFILAEGSAQAQVIEHHQAGCYYVTGSNSLDDVLPESYSWGSVIYQGIAATITPDVRDVA